MMPLDSRCYGLALPFPDFTQTHHCGNRPYGAEMFILTRPSKK